MALLRHVLRTTLAISGLVAIGSGSASAQHRTALAHEHDGLPDRPGLEWPARLVVRDVPLATALTRLYETAGVPVSFSPSLLPRDRVVSCDCDTLTVADALDRLLRDTRLLYREIDGHVLVYRGLDSMRPRQSITPASRYALLVGGDASVTPIARLPLDPTGIILGTVTEQGTTQPVAGAQVSLDGTGRALTDSDGRYRIAAVDAGAHTVAVEVVGYSGDAREVQVEDGATVMVDFVLEPTATMLNEIVVTATGEQRRLEVANAIGHIPVDSVVGRMPVAGVADVLNGRIAGVQVLSHNGYAGQAPRIRIRGLNSGVASNQPIIILDGIRLEETSGNFRGFTGLIGEPVNRLADLIPADIESIEVVKGPSAATLYGTDAANGVLVIRTKRGQIGRTAWNVFIEQNINQVSADWPDNYYAWGHTVADNSPTQCLLDQVAAGACVQDSVTHVNPLMEAASSPFATGSRTAVGVQVSGGVERLRYFLSGNLDRDNGVLRTPEAEVARVLEERGVALSYDQTRPNRALKASLRGNVSATLSDNANVTLSTSFLRNDTRLPDANLVIASAWYGAGSADSPDFWRRGFGAPGDSWTKDALESTNRTTLSLAANWRPISWLTTRATLGGDFVSTFVDALNPRGLGVGQNIEGRRYNERSSVDVYTVDLGATATSQLSGTLSSRTSIGAQYNRRNFGLTAVTASNLLPGSQTSIGAATVTPTEQNFFSAIAGAYVEETLGWKERLFATVAVRADAGGAFGRDVDAAYYPKVSGSWIISEEPFFSGLRDRVDVLRLRAAYGESGVQPHPTAALALATPVNVLTDGTPQPGATLTTFGNPQLKPERQAEIEAGFDLQLLDGRVAIEATYYTRKSSDALVLAPFAPSLGYAARQENLGSVRNRGFEGLLTARVFETGGTALDLSFNGSINENRVLKVGPGQLTRQIGRPLFAVFSRRIVSYEDADGNGLLGMNEIVFTDTAVYAGQNMPPRQLSAQASLTLFNGQLMLSTMFDRRSGHVYRAVGERNRCLGFLNCRGQNDPTASLEQQARDLASRALGFAYLNPMEGDYTRWREVSAQIQLPVGLVSHFGAASGTLVLAGRNLGLIGDFFSVDPEMYGQNFTDEPSSFPVVPPVRSWVIRLNLGF